MKEQEPLGIIYIITNKVKQQSLHRTNKKEFVRKNETSFFKI